MSYLVLARKWRPQKFEEVIGQTHVTRVLQNAIRMGRVAHAYLFSGPRGVGKTSVARILAKALNCESGPTPEPCGICSRCSDIATGKFSDVLEIDGASHRGIDSIRSLQESIGYKPVKGRFKIYIIDEVHMLTTEAFNALLKTLEEPPPHVRFVFATTEVHRVPATVLSRCQRFDFRRIPAREISSHLERIISAEKISVSPSILDAIAVEADGSLRDAQTLLEQVIAFQDENINDDELLKLLGMVDRSTLFNVLKAVVEGDKKASIKLAQEIYESGYDEVKFLNRLLDMIHRLLIIKMMHDDPLTPHQERLKMSDYDFSLLENLSKKLSNETLELYYQILIRGIELAKKSSQPHFVLEMSLLRMASVPDIISMPDLLQALKEIMDKSRQVRKDVAIFPKLSQAQKTALQDVPKESSIGKTANDVISQWNEFLSWLASHDSVLHVQVAKSTVRYGDRPNEIVLSVIPVYGESLRKGPSHDRLMAALNRFFRIKDLNITVEDSEDLAKSVKQNQNRIDVKQLEKEMRAHPVVREILEMFNGSIVDIRANAYSQNYDGDEIDYET